MRHTKTHHTPIKTKSKLKRQAWKVLYREIENNQPVIRTRWFRNFEEAEAFCKIKQSEAKLSGDGSFLLSEKLKLEAIACQRLLESTGTSLTDAVKYYLKETDILAKTNATVEEVASGHISRLKRLGRGHAYIIGIEGFLKRFCRDFGKVKIASVKEHQLEKWLDGCNPNGDLSTVSVNNLRNNLVVFFSYAVAKKILAENPALGIAKVETRKRGVERPNRLITPEELKIILANAPERIKPSLVLMALCGIRIAEVARLKWSHINTEDKVISISQAVSKTNSSRTVPMTDLVSRYLAKQSRGLEGFIYQARITTERKGENASNEIDFNRVRLLTKELRRFRERVGVYANWKRNALRASAISYRVATVGNAYVVAEEMGNSPEVINATYKNLATPRQAAKWFAIDPSNPGGRFISERSELTESPFPEDWSPDFDNRTGKIKNLPKGITYDPKDFAFGGKAKGWAYDPELGGVSPMISFG